MTKIAVFDIDGTLSDNSHRTKWVEQRPKDWNRYNATMHLDTPIPEMVDLARSLRDGGYTIVLCTGRSLDHYGTTCNWMLDNRIKYDWLFMRNAGDRRPDTVVKVELLNQIRERIGPPTVWFDDRDGVVKVLREEGVRVLQVAPGAF